MKHIYRKLVQNFSSMKCFEGWMIAKVDFNVTKPELDKYINTENIQILRQRKNYSAVMSKTVYNGVEYMLIMHIIKPSGKYTKKNSASDICGTYLFALKYTRDDIQQFVQSVGDSNYIHQSARPVVPGFLIFEDIILKTCEERAEDCTIVFKSPAFADETIDVFKQYINERGTVYGIYNRRS